MFPHLTFALLAFQAGLSASSPAPTDSLELRVRIGESDFGPGPIHGRIELARLPESLRSRIQNGSVAVSVVGVDSAEVGGAGDAQLEVWPGSGSGGASARLLWMSRGVLPKRSTVTARVMFPSNQRSEESHSPWSWTLQQDGGLVLKLGETVVFHYKTLPVNAPGGAPIQARDAYLHPVFSPSGALITGDFSPFHTHHRGFFLAYTKVAVGDAHPDFWNFHQGKGRIVFDQLDGRWPGPVSARFRSRHRWQLPDGKVVLREQWDLEAYRVPETPYWLFDLTSTQQAEDLPLVLDPYRYGGMAYRGAEPFVKGGIDVLTDLGRGRKERDQKPARWVDLTGPIAEGSTNFAGACILDHPANENHPTIARIHPTTLPFFSFVPSHDRVVTITKDTPKVFRYRVLVHDGHPDGTLDERLWHDFAAPPRVEVVDGRP